MSRASRLRLFIIFLQFFSLSYAATCYTRDGDVLDASAYRPCDNATAFSSCCLLDQGNGGPGDICTSAGLCLRQDSIPGFLYIDGCTDKSWADSSCPNFCSSMSQTTNLIRKKRFAERREKLSNLAADMATDSSQSVVQACNDVGVGTWCCRASGEPSCCSEAFTSNVGALIIPSQTTYTVSETKTIAATGVSTSDTAAATSNSASSTSAAVVTESCAAATKDKSAVVGGSVGGVMGVALLLSLGALFWREKTRPKRNGNGNIQAVEGEPGVYGYYQKPEMEAGPYEARSRDIQEMDGSRGSR